MQQERSDGSERSCVPMSGQIYRPVVVAMTVMRMMQSTVHKVINVITVRYGFVAAVRAVNVT
jgi:hypothetical protein